MEYATWKMIQELNAALRTARLTDLGCMPCPRCRELIRPDAVVCPFCGVRACTRRPTWRSAESVEEVTVIRAPGSSGSRPRAGRKAKVGT